MAYPRSPEAQAESDRIRRAEKRLDEFREAQEEKKREKKRKSLERARQSLEERRELRRQGRDAGIWDDTNDKPRTTPIKDLSTKISPKEHKKRLDGLYQKYMAVYERGLESQDLKIALKCADVIREMHIGRAGQGEPAQDIRNSELMVLGQLPDVESGPTAQELEAEQMAEEEQPIDEVEEEDEDDDDRSYSRPAPRFDEQGNPIEVIEEEFEDRYE